MSNVLTPFISPAILHRFQEFPKMLHHESGQTVTVSNKDEEKRYSARPGWSDSPSYPKYYTHLDGRQAIVKNRAEEDRLLKLKPDEMESWFLHPCSERDTARAVEDVDQKPAAAKKTKIEL